MKILYRTIVVAALFTLLPSTVFAENHHSIDFIVKKGDNLYSICEKILEDPEDWRWVAMVNRIEDPHYIFPGQVLTIPTRLLKGIPIEGKITFLKDRAFIKTIESGQWKELQLNDRVSQGNLIRTGDQSVVEISFEEDFSILMRPGTTLEISAARKKSAIYLMYKLFLDIGKAITKIKKSTGKETRFEIETPSAVETPRGTEFRTNVDSEVTTRLEVLEGKVGVQAAKKQVWVNAGEGSVVKKDEAPVSPVKMIPPPDLLNLLPLYRTMPLSFQFENVPGAISYRIMVSRDEAFKDVVADNVIKPGETLLIKGMEDGTYFLRSRSIDDLGLEGRDLDPLIIKVRINPLPPFIESPADGAELREKEVLFKWLSVARAAAYRLQIAEDPDFHKIIADSGNITDVFQKHGGLDYRSYYFRVRSIADDGYEGIWSDVLRFAVIPPPPSPPVEKPEIGEKQMQVRWKDLGKDVVYRFQLAKDKDFKELIMEEKTETPEIRFENPVDSGTYFIRTSAIDAQGYEGDFSEPQSFEIKDKFYFYPAAIMVLTFVAVILL